MSGRVSPQDVVAALYRTVDDDRLPWLDGLLIAAGFMRRCPCGLPAPADERCDQRGRDEPDVVGVFDVCRGEAEATFTIGPLSEGDPLLRIGIAAAGGGAVGAACPDNDWIYEVHLADVLVLRCGPALRRRPAHSPADGGRAGRTPRRHRPGARPAPPP